MKQRRIKIVTNEGRGARVIDTETGADLSNTITAIVIRMDKSTDLHAVAEVTFMDVDIEMEANTRVETMVAYRHLEVQS